MQRPVKRKSDPWSRGEGQEKENTGGLELTEREDRFLQKELGIYLRP